MFFEKYFERWKLLLAFMTGICCVVYFILFRPLSQNVTDVQSQLKTEKQKILLNSRYGFLPDEIESNFGKARDENKQLQESLENFRKFFDFSGSLVITNVYREFNYNEFDNERRRLIASLLMKADIAGVSIPYEVLSSLPDFSIGNIHPELLWVHLETFRFVFETIFAIKDLTIHSINAPDIRTIANPGNPQLAWKELTSQWHMSGPGDKLLQFIKFIPLPANELRKTYDMDVPGKPAYILGSVLLTRESQKPDSATLKIDVSGVIQVTNKIENVIKP
ncbi:MAG: hypothetical protein LR011_01420 [Verrucomicrobia bacterium]|nr:hypothetical protein [Verrucomicrobiota bacterium]